jgi:creatinine amidohydrolase
MRLQHCTWAEVEGYLERSRGVIVPIGSTEQHGPNGLIGTDAMCAEAIAEGVGEAADALVAPVIGVGIAQHHMAFAGSMTLKPSTMVALIGDIVDSLAHHGFRRFFFINGHGGNVSTINASFQEIYARQSLEAGDNAGEVRCAFKNWWMNSGVKAISNEHFAGREGAHATPSEVSLTQHLFPDSIKTVAMDGPAPGWSDFFDADDYRRRYPDGRIGSDPSLASPEAGARLLTAAVKSLAEDYRRFVSAE